MGMKSLAQGHNMATPVMNYMVKQLVDRAKKIKQKSTPDSLLLSG